MSITPRRLLQQLGGAPPPRFDLQVYFGDRVRGHLTLASHGNPTWAIDLQDVRGRTTRDTWIRGGTAKLDEIGVDVPELEQLPAWLRDVERRLRIDFGIADARVEVGRNRSLEPLLRAWLAPGASAPARPETLLDWAKAPSRDSRSAKAAKAQLAWIALRVRDWQGTRADARTIARALADSYVLVRAALRGGVAGVLRAELSRALVDPDLVVTWPLYQHVLAELLRGDTPVATIAAFAHLATSFAHLPGMLKQRRKLHAPIVADAAASVARRWPAWSRKHPGHLSLADYAVLIALASGRSRRCETALDAIATGQQIAAKLQGDPDWACADVIARVRGSR